MIDLLKLTLNKQILNWSGNVTKSISLGSQVTKTDYYKGSIQKKTGFSPKDYLYKSIDALDDEAEEEIDNLKIKEYDLEYIKKNIHLNKIKEIPFFFAESTDFSILITRSDLYKYSVRVATINEFEWNPKVDFMNIGNYKLFVPSTDTLKYNMELELIIKRGELVFGEIRAYSLGIMEGTYYVENPNSIEEILLIDNQIRELGSIIFKKP
ncbi:hypothetical protein ACFWMS_25030 [Peribacillus butanolivorans]|uniref:hypothetical protein n=1 Tax=Peribacillus butanolivorans TaxID=421767 RepID=UPI003646CE74